MSPRRAVALLVAVFVALAACSSSGGDATERRDTTSSTTRARGAGAAKLRWHSCGNAECATFQVPLDHAHPGGKEIALALGRVRARNADARIGSLLFDLGGPGGPGADAVEHVASALPETISDRFDIVGWDPRGTGRSSPVECGARLDYLFAPDSAPDNPAEAAALERSARRFARSCDRRSPQLIRHVATIDTVRDLDRIRAALGESKLSFLGFSYGTYLGAVYAQMYPERVRAMVLDGALDPALPADEVAIEQAEAFELSLDAFLDNCARNRDCEFHHDGKPRKALEALRTKIDRHPMRSDDGRLLGPTQFDVALASPLYEGADGYKDLAHALHRTEGGDPSEMIESFDDYVGRNADGTYTSEWSAFLAISCADGPVLSPAALAKLERRAAVETPIFGAATLGLSLPCSYWPVPVVNPVPAPVTAPDAPPIVVVSTTGDPVTPLAWAEGLARQLGTARLVTVDGTAHTSTLGGNPCLDDALVRYLVALRPPGPDLHCPA